MKLLDRGPHRIAGQLMYGGGLRVSECAMLRVKDLDLDLDEPDELRRGAQ